MNEPKGKPSAAGCLAAVVLSGVVLAIICGVGGLLAPYDKPADPNNPWLPASIRRDLEMRRRAEWLREQRLIDEMEREEAGMSAEPAAPNGKEPSAEAATNEQPEASGN